MRITMQFWPPRIVDADGAPLDDSGLRTACAIWCNFDLAKSAELFAFIKTGKVPMQYAASQPPAATPRRVVPLFDPQRPCDSEGPDAA